MENASAKIYLRDDFQRKDGTNPIYLRVTIKRRTKKYSLTISVFQKYWDAEKLRVKRGDLKHLSKNHIIESSLITAQSIINDLKTQRVPITFEAFESRFLVKGEKKNKDSFLDFFLSEVECDYKHKGSYDTYRSRITIINKLRTFANGDIVFSDIDLDFIKRYENHMINLGNNQSTRAKNLRSIKAMINRAIVQGLMKENPTYRIKYSEKRSEREYLTKEEVKALLELFRKEDTHKSIKRALEPFLFCCFTGIRYRDIRDLKFKNVVKVKGINGVETTMLRFVMHKTKEFHEVPLIPEAMALLPKKTFNEDNVFKVYTNQPQNRFLKVAMKMAQIKKKISFHCSRHTFATLVLGSNQPIEVVSKLLGHQDIKTTQIYAKILPQSKINAVNALSAFMNE
jgi:integrase